MFVRHFYALTFISVVFGSCGSSVSAQAVKDAAASTQRPVESVVTRDYDFSAAIEKYVAQSDLPADQARRNAIVELFAPFVGGSSIVKWEETSENVFRVVGDEIGHQQVEGVAQWLLHDCKQITIETRIVTVSEETLKGIHRQFAKQWEMTPIEQPPIASEHPFQTVSSSAPTRVAGVLPTLYRDHSHAAASSMSTTMSLPCRFVRLTNAQNDRLVPRLQNDTRTNLMQSPKVTMFPGQRSVVKDTKNRPFVVSVKPNEDGSGVQPIIKVLEEGLTIDLKADLLPKDRLAISSEVRFNRIGNVDTFTFDIDGASGTSVQIPEQHTKQVGLAVELKDGETLLIDPHFFTEETIKRTFRKDKRKRKYTLLLVTPRIIIQETEAADGDVVAKL